MSAMLAECVDMIAPCLVNLIMADMEAGVQELGCEVSNEFCRVRVC